MTVRHTLLASVSMTPIERLMGRFMRAPDHPGFGGEDDGGGDDDDGIDDGGDNDDNDDQSDQSDDIDDGDDQEGDEDGSDPSDDDKPKRGRGFEKRINRLTARNKELERQLNEARGNGKKTEGAKTSDPSVKPALKDFDTYEEWVEALTDWKSEQKLTQARNQDAENERNRTFQQKFTKGQKQFKDWNDVVTDDVQISKTVVDVLKESDYPAELAYYLASNEEELEAINEMRPAKQAIALGKIEAKIERQNRQNKAKDTSAEPREHSKAPAPINPTRGGGKTINKPYEKMTMAEFISARNREERQR